MATNLPHAWTRGKMPAIETDTCRKTTRETSNNNENVKHFLMYDAKAESGRVFFEIHKYVFSQISVFPEPSVLFLMNEQ